MTNRETLVNVGPLEREPLATQVARKLVEYIIAGSFQPGDRMPPERQLAEAFGVGRSAMREALKSLSLIGLVEVRQGDGTYLRHADATLLPHVIEWGLLMGERRTLDLVEARQCIECDIAELAATRRTDDDLIALERALRDMHDTADQERFVNADVAFHLQLAQAAHNSALRDIHASIQSLLRVWIGRVIHAAASTAPSYAEHVPIFAAVRAGEPAAARQAMHDHMTAAAGRLERALAAEPPRTAPASALAGTERKGASS
ncbi:MAG TPA: FadR/GntR family transcriptional regulator [Thermomicrobiales bacterium]|nr:FadR/GntR family transcriptional regulator [Thermomicrobiales bacterium]